MKLRILLFLTLSSLCLGLNGQTLKSNLRRAKRAFTEKNYAESLQRSERLLAKDSLMPEALHLAAESAYHLRQFKRTEEFLERMPVELRSQRFPQSELTLAIVKRHLGHYSAAQGCFQQYLDANPKLDEVKALSIRQQIANCEWAMRQMRNPIGAELSNPEAYINSEEFSEFAPLRFTNKTFYSSAYKDSRQEFPVSRIYAARDRFSGQILDFLGSEKQGAQVAHTSLMPDASKMYLTLCRDEPYFQQKKCEIWVSERTYEGEWAKPKKLPDFINLKGFTATQPSIGWDPKERRYALYFASNRPGGKGSMDIWCSLIHWDGTLDVPFCLPFNTAGDELTPFFHPASQTLFFSSDGMEGMGGQDIFFTKKEGSNDWKTPQNMGFPLNSSGDDLYYTFHSKENKGYLATNRDCPPCLLAAQGDPCTDIKTSRILMDFNIAGMDTRDSSRIDKFFVTATNIDTGASTIFEKSEDDDYVVVRLDLGQRYKLNLTASGFLPAIFHLNTEQIVHHQSFKKVVELLPNNAGESPMPKVASFRE